MIETLIPQLLNASTAVTSLIGTRIYPVYLKNNATLPALDFKIISATPDPTFQTEGMTRYRVEINCWGNTYSDAVNLRAAVKASLNGFYDGHTVVRFLSIQDFGEDTLLQYRALIEFYVFA